jgi:hypothetical protein
VKLFRLLIFLVSAAALAQSNPKIRSFAELPGGRLIVYSAEDHSRDSVGFFDKQNGKFTKVLDARPLHDLSPAPNGQLVAMEVRGSALGRLIVFDIKGSIIAELDHPNGWYYNRFFWSPQGDKIYFCMNPSGMSDDDGGGMEFGAIGVFDIRSKRLASLKLKTMRSDLEILPFERGFIASSDEQSVSDFYNAKGIYLKTSRLPASVMSATGTYCFPHLNEAGLAWTIFNCRTKQEVMHFPGSSDLSNYVGYERWNPKIDRYLLAGRSARGTYTTVIIDVVNHKIILEIPEKPNAWSADGKSLLTYSEGKFTSHPLAPQ